MFDRRKGYRHEDEFSLIFEWNGARTEALVMNISWTGILIAFPKISPIGPGILGQNIRFLTGFEEGPFLRPQALAIRFFESEDAKNLALRFQELPPGR